MPERFPLPDGSVWTPCEEPGVLPQFEGVAVDQRSGVLYAAQEDVGLWRLQLPLGPRSEPTLVDRVTDFGIHDVYDEESEECTPVDPDVKGFGGTSLTADAEGVDIYYGHGRDRVRDRVEPGRRHASPCTTARAPTVPSAGSVSTESAEPTTSTARTGWR